MAKINSKVNSLVSCQWLIENLDNPQVIVVDCRFQLANPQWGSGQYLAGHIPGAYYLDLDKDMSSSVAKHGGRHPLPNPEQLAAKLASIGVVWGETLVVAYDDSRFAFAARLWWLLRYLGHDLVALLDGGWNAWQQQGYPISREIPSPKLCRFIPQPKTGQIVEIETVKACKDSSGVILIDSREPERYRGEREPIDPIAGAIPGAVNSPWQQVSDENGFFKSISEQQNLWESYQNAEEIIVYCGSGVTACVNLLSLELAGFRNTKLYPGGWSDWCSYLT